MVYTAKTHTDSKTVYRGIIRIHGRSIFVVFVGSFPTNLHPRQKQTLRELVFVLKPKTGPSTELITFPGINR